MEFMGLFEFLNKGGWVSYVLATLSLVLWYGLGYRYFFLRTPYLKVRPQQIVKQKSLVKDDLLGSAIAKMQNIFSAPMEDRDIALRSSLTDVSQELETHKQMIRSIVIVAPLLGLLGTVIGMIETFSSLQDSALFSQSGGIAGGISQALITTQMGLVVAIPGLLVGRKLDKQQENIQAYLEQAASLFVTQERDV